MPAINAKLIKKLFLLLTLCTVVLFVIVWVRISREDSTDGSGRSEYSRRREHRLHQQSEYVDRSGIKVVVGHYVGHSLGFVPNATKELINTNLFNPQPDAGKNGNPVVVAPQDLIRMQQLFQINRFNLMASDRIPLNRTLPDFRRKRCGIVYNAVPMDLSVSIIIVFHNEAWSTLLRTVWSVILRTPRGILKEIILVDDCSDRAFLKAPLDEYVSSLPISTKLVRSDVRIGLIKARVQGARAANGDILIFLDAHCEVTIGWIEPLVDLIRNDRKAVACPVIDIINDDTFAYTKSFELHWGAFNWNLQFRWFTLSGEDLAARQKDVVKPFKSPAMAGGLFAIDRKYFWDLGGYDEDMEVWGGENLELSFRVWQCGGSIQIVPCSHVGHLFRKSSPYSFPKGILDTLFSNLAKVALVWMDEWSAFYFKFNREARAVMNRQNVTVRKQLRRQLRCRPFGWYLNEVWPQHFFPTSDRFFGRIRNIGRSEKCLVRPQKQTSANQPVGIAMLDNCIDQTVSESTSQLFVMTKNGFVMTDNSICLDAPEKKRIGVLRVRIMACSGQSRQRWSYDAETKELKHTTNQLCLDMAPIDSDGLIITNCTKLHSQRWKFEPVAWH